MAAGSHGLAAGWKHLLGALLSWGPQGLFVLAILDSAGLPVIGGVDALLIALAISSPALAFLAAICAVAGSLIGSSILFAIARKGGEVLLARHISGKRGARLHSWFERYGLVTVFIPALSPLPLPMKIPVFCAGALEVRWPYFLGVVGAARCIRYFSLAYLSSRYGLATFAVLRTHWVSVLCVAIVLVLVALVVLQVAERIEARVKRAVSAEGVQCVGLKLRGCCASALSSAPPQVSAQPQVSAPPLSHPTQDRNPGPRL